MLFLHKIPNPFLLMLDSDYGKNIDDLVKRFHGERLKRLGYEATEWEVETSADNRGKIAFATLHYDKELGTKLLFCAFQGDVQIAVEQEAGDLILTLAGFGKDVEGEGKPFDLKRGSIIMHGPSSAHCFRSTTFWVFLYYRPFGNKDPKGFFEQ